MNERNAWAAGLKHDMSHKADDQIYMVSLGGINGLLNIPHTVALSN
jgi:hypothetical protein